MIAALVRGPAAKRSPACRRARLPGPAEIAKAKLVHRAPLDPATWRRDESWRVALARILETIDAQRLAGSRRSEARKALATASLTDLEALADRFLGGRRAAGEAAQAVFVAAALQVAWTRMAALLERVRPRSRPMRGLCPACGSPPVAGMISPGGTKFGHRHLHCSLCATVLALRAGALRALRQHRQDLVPPARRDVLPARRMLRELPAATRRSSTSRARGRWSRWPTISARWASTCWSAKRVLAACPNPFVLGVMDRQEG